MILTELPSRIPAIVESVEEHGPQDAIARRLRELGFVNGEEVEVVAKGPLGAEPLLVQIGYTRFALRRSEAAPPAVAAHTASAGDRPISRTASATRRPRPATVRP